MSERLSRKPDPKTRTEKRWSGRVFRGQIPEETDIPGLKKLGRKDTDLIDVSTAPGLISGLTPGEVQTLFDASRDVECSLPEGGFSIVGPQHFVQTGRINRAGEGY
jgi:hypothetical protein